MRRLLGCLMLVGALVVVTVSSVEAQFGFGGFGKQTAASLVMNKSVQEELKLTDEQKKAFTDGQKESFGLMGKMDFAEMAKLKDLKAEERDAKIAEMMKPLNEFNEKLLEKNLKPEQTKRLNQIVRQQAGVQVFAQADVQKELGFTDEQKKKVKGILDDLKEDVAEITKSGTEKGKGGFGGRLTAEAREKINKLNTKAKETIIDGLTADQKTKWKDSVGEPFELKNSNPFGGGGFPKKDN